MLRSVFTAQSTDASLPLQRWAGFHAVSDAVAAGYNHVAMHPVATITVATC